MKDFRKLLIWEKGMELTVACYSVTKALPANERFGLAIQINRAAVSVPTNIAEGNSRTSDKDNRRYIEIALGSCNELETLFILLEKLNLAALQVIRRVIEIIREEQRLLWSFMQKLNH